jgi:peptidoglycan/xylan/chitin deacetylase (PgdA/CDA1 family)
VPHKKIPILCYHQIGEPGEDPDSQRHTIKPSVFDRQMRYLKEQGFSSIRLDDLPCVSQARSLTAALPSKVIAITFDDGYQDTFTTAFPILQKYGFVATVFVTTGFVGSQHGWRDANSVPYMTWSEAKELATHGFGVEGHTCTHPNLKALAVEKVRQELSDSKLEIEQQLGLPVRHLAFPFGYYNQSVKDVARELGYQSAYAVSMGSNDCFDIERQMMFAYDSPRAYRLKVSGWGEWGRAVYHTIKKPRYEVG